MSPHRNISLSNYLQMKIPSQELRIPSKRLKIGKPSGFPLKLSTELRKDLLKSKMKCIPDFAMETRTRLTPVNSGTRLAPVVQGSRLPLPDLGSWPSQCQSRLQGSRVQFSPLWTQAQYLPLVTQLPGIH